MADSFFMHSPVQRKYAASAAHGGQEKSSLRIINFIISTFRIIINVFSSFSSEITQEMNASCVHQKNAPQRAAGRFFDQLPIPFILKYTRPVRK